MGRGWGESGSGSGRKRRCGLAVADYIHCGGFGTVWWELLLVLLWQYAVSPLSLVTMAWR
jgi:hypothetical protein